MVISLADPNSWWHWYDQYVEKKNNNQQIYLWLSGGRDSVAMLHWFNQAWAKRPEFCWTALFFNHHWHSRSDAWQCLVRQISLAYGWAFLAIDLPVSHNETTARMQRWQASRQCQGVHVLAHHADDRLETVLLQWLRGSGRTDNMSLVTTRPGQIICRPWLKISREEINHYVTAHQLIYIEDPSNQDERIPRNWLRHHWLPQLTAHWPAWRQTMQLSLDDEMLYQDLLWQEWQPMIEQASYPFGWFAVRGWLSRPAYALLQVLRFWLLSFHIPLPSRKQLGEFIQQTLRPWHGQQARLQWADYQLRMWRGWWYLQVGSEQSIQPCIPSDQPMMPLSKKKLAKLFQQHHVPPWLRPCWPIKVDSQGELLAVAGLWARSPEHHIIWQNDARQIIN